MGKYLDIAKKVLAKSELAANRQGLRDPKDYSPQELDEALRGGCALYMFSTQLDDYFHLVQGEAESTRFLKRYPDIATYTVAELDEIGKRAWPIEHLRQIHRIKKIMGCSVVSDA